MCRCFTTQSQTCSTTSLTSWLMLSSRTLLRWCGRLAGQVTEGLPSLFLALLTWLCALWTIAICQHSTVLFASPSCPLAQAFLLHQVELYACSIPEQHDSSVRMCIPADGCDRHFLFPPWPAVSSPAHALCVCCPCLRSTTCGHQCSTCR